jgi:hypothetical protein
MTNPPRSRASSYGSYGDLGKQRSGSCGDESVLSSNSNSANDGVGRGARLNKV